MTTRQATRDPLLRGVSPTPSKIPVRSQKRTPFPTVTSCALDQENQDPRKWLQKPPLNIQRPLVDSAGPRLKAKHQAETSQRLVGIPQPRNPLEELRPSPRGQNVGPGPPAQTVLVPPPGKLFALRRSPFPPAKCHLTRCHGLYL
ncbi:tastin isoform X2 [Piliocolobus tephrosceles]|uniref:tastin isoform X2 n=1 Tax=Piliocolobus tephrosceles TaxID=591936 RepID=UPI000C2AB0EE|nr:tastin isoform X2 [Piliocolobus tephrosceles]